MTREILRRAAAHWFHSMVAMVCIAAAPAARAESGLYGGSVSGSFNLTDFPAETNVYATADMLCTNDNTLFTDNTTWVYWGYMQLEQGDWYFLKQCWDDGIYLKIGDTVLINNNTYNVTVGAVFTAPESGLYYFELRAGQGTGGVGPVNIANGDGVYYWRGSEKGDAAERRQIGNYDATVFYTEIGWLVGGNFKVAGCEPEYGTYPFEDGVYTRTFTAPSSASDDTRQFELSGYEVYRYGELGKQLFKTGADATVTIDRGDAESVELVWIWQVVSNKLTATSADSDKGTVEVEQEWVAPGEAFAAIATPADGYAFAYWTGDLPERCKYLNPLSMPAQAPYAIQAVFGKAVPVSNAGNVQDAVTAAGADATEEAPGVVVLADGVYTPANFQPYIVDGEEEGTTVTNAYLLTISAPVVVRSATGAAGAVAISGGEAWGAATIESGSLVRRPFALLNAAGAAFAGVEISNFSNTAVRVEAGTFANARVTQCWTSAADQIVTATGSGALVCDSEICGNTHNRGIYATTAALGLWKRATAQRCAIHSNRSITGCYSYGAGGVVMCDGTTLSECVVSNNYIKGGRGDGADSIAGGIRTGVDWTSTRDRIENCLIANNTLDTSGLGAGGIYLRNSGGGNQVVNCTVVGNRILSSNSGNSGIYATGGANTMINTIISGNDDGGQGYTEFSSATYSYSLLPGDTLPSGTGNLLASPVFVDAARGDYRLKLYSPGRDAGTAADAAIDLDGNPRAVGPAVDMGAFEIQASDIVQISKEQTACAAPVEFAVQAGVGRTPAKGASWTWTLLNEYGETIATEQHDSAGAMVDSWSPNITGKGSWTIRVEVEFPSGETAVDETTIVAIGDTAYVSASGSNETPYDTWETAATSIAAAIAQVAPAATADRQVQVVLAAGEYAPAEDELVNDYMVEVPSYVTLKGEGIVPEDTVLDARQMRGVKLNAGARLENLTVTNCLAAGVAGYAFGIYAVDAAIENCVLKNGQGIDASEPYVIVNGGAVSDFTVADSTFLCEVNILGGALVEHLVMTNMGLNAGSPRYGLSVSGSGTRVSRLYYAGNRVAGRDYFDAYHVHLQDGAEICDSEISGNLIAVGSAYSSGIRTVWNQGGTLRRVQICRNSHQTSNSVTYNYYLTAGVEQTAGTIDNCLIADNRLDPGSTKITNLGERRAAGLRLAGGSVVNTTIAGNVCTYASDVQGVVYIGGTILNSIVAGNGFDGAGVQIAKVGHDETATSEQTHSQVTENITCTLVAPCGDEALDPAGDGVLIADARFKNAAAGNYRIASDSPALKAGQAFEEVTYDLDGNVRDAGKRCDLGCYIGHHIGMRVIMR